MKKKYNKKGLKEQFDKVSCSIADKMSIDMSGFWLTAYVKMFEEFPHILCVNSDGIYLKNIFPDDEDDENIEEIDYTEDRESSEIYTFDNINIWQTMINIYDYYDKLGAYIIRNDEFPIIIADHIIIYVKPNTNDIMILIDNEYIPDEVLELVNEHQNDDDSRWVSYVTYAGQGFTETGIKVEKPDVDLKMFYNDDLPDKQINDFLNSDKSGLVLLHGAVGSGKTTYIRNLIYTFKARHFMILDSSVFNCITDASFIQLLLQNHGAVIILEDCESMLMDRAGGNNQLSALLNLSDGILGDNFNLKFICTFNTNIAKLDKAVLRKGRLAIKYEFKALTPEKTKALCKKNKIKCKPDESLTLADIFNYNSETGVAEDTKIGFSK